MTPDELKIVRRAYSWQAMMGLLAGEGGILR